MLKADETIDITQEEMQIPDPVDFIKHYVGPHEKISRDVTDADLPKLMEDAHIMYNLCFTKNGKYYGGFAVAHCQINDSDPLKFFVTADKEVVINPVMLNHTAQELDKMEGCLSFPDMEMVPVKRYNKCTVEYSRLAGEGEIGERITENISGKRAQIFQHEMQHFAGENIYQSYGKGI